MSTINLLPEDYVRRRSQHHANVICLILFSIVMVSVIGAAVVSEQNTQHTQQVRDEVNASYADAARLIEQMQQLEAQKGAMLGKAHETALLMERVPRSYLLGIVANALPANTSLVQYDLDVKAVVNKAAIESARGKSGESKETKFAAGVAGRPEPPPSFVTMEVTGLAGTDVDVARFIANLARNPLIGSVDLVYSDEKLVDKTPVREFKVRLELRPNADAIDAVREGPQMKPGKVESLVRADAGAGT